MAEALCRHEWTDVSVNGDTRLVQFCHKCDTYWFKPRPTVPEGDLYYLQEVTSREEEDNDGPR